MTGLAFFALLQLLTWPEPLIIYPLLWSFNRCTLVLYCDFAGFELVVLASPVVAGVHINSGTLDLSELVPEMLGADQVTSPVLS